MADGSAAPGTPFETAIRLMAGSTQAVPDRNAVVTTTASSDGGDGASSMWLVDWGVDTTAAGGGLSTNYDHWWRQKIYHGGTFLEVVVRVNDNKAYLNNPSNPWMTFINSVDTVLGSLSTWPWQTDQFSPTSMGYAAVMLEDIGELMDTWTQNFTAWSNSVDVSGSDFQGSAAGVFKHTLDQYAANLKAIRTQLTSSQIAKSLWDSENAMNAGWKSIATAWQAWRENSQNMPSVITNFLFQEALDSAPIHWRYVASHARYEPKSIPTSWFGDVIASGDAFWKNLDAGAKSWWAHSLGGLDAAGTSFLPQLDTAYKNLSNTLPLNFVPPVVLSPPGTDVNGGSSAGGGPGGNLDFPPITIPPPKIDTGNGSNNPPKVDPSSFTTSAGGSGGGVAGPPNFNSDFSTSPSGGPNPAGDFSTSSGAIPNVNSDFTTAPDAGGSPDIVTGPNGQPVLGSDGQPVTVPSGSTISSDGSVVGPNGQPVLGVNGQPLTVPKGSSLATSDFVTGPNGQPVLGPGGQPVTVPSGSTISSDGSVVGPNGQPVLGVNGQPLTVPTGSSVTPPDASVVDGNSSTAPFDTPPSTVGGVDPSSTVGSVLNGAPLPGAGTSLPLPNVTTGGISFPPAGSLSKAASFLSGGGSATGDFTSGGGIGSPSPFESGATGSEAGSAVEPGTPPGETLPGTERTAETADLVAAADESQALGRIATVGGASGAGAGEPPFIPPMSGGGGGGAGGSSGGGKKTWVTEDQSTWGTTASAGSGVIGR